MSDTWEEEQAQPKLAQDSKEKAGEETAAATEEAVPDNPPGAGRAAGEEWVAPKPGEVPDGRRFKVEPPAVQFQWHEVVVGSDWTPVSELRIGPVLSAARDAGVTITEEGASE